jgi:diguanylate cyclase (GGDEF)-like protein
VARTAVTRLTAATESDLQNCEQEPIHAPGSIQPHGFLLAAAAEDLRITHASANLPGWWGLPAGEVTGRPLRDIIGSEACTAMVKAITSERYAGATVLSRILPLPDSTTGYILAHQNGDQIIVEIEPDRRNTEFESALAKAQSVIARLHGTKSLDALSHQVVQEIRSLTSYDRVMVLRFDAEGNGEIIAEDRAENLHSLAGLRYPASDIPNQARRLHLSQRVRLIPTVDYDPVPVLQGHGLNHPALDMSYCSLRSMSPAYLQYLRNMGVSATLAVSIIQNQQLWGIIICHHNQPLITPPGLRAVCDLVGQFMGNLIAQVEERQNLSAQVERTQHLATIARYIFETGTSITQSFANHADELLRLVGATGAWVSLAGERKAFGNVPNDSIAQEILQTFRADDSDEITAIEDLGHRLPHFRQVAATAAGVLVLPIANHPGDGLIWFRPEVPKTIIWGGDPRHRARIDRNTGIISPRTSFAPVKQVIKGHSARWTESDRQAAQNLRRIILRGLLRQKEAELIRIANTDPLTGLANRRVLHQHIGEWQMSDHQRPAALLFCDLDRFKTVNDSLGHSTGDHLLIEVTKRLSKLVAGKHLLVRIGGDEFVIFCPGVTKTASLALAQDVLKCFEPPFLVNERPHHASASIGVAYSKTPSDNLLREADAAMFEAKRQGSNRAVLFQNNLHKKVLSNLRTEQDLFGALERQELVVHYQPIAALPGGQYVGFEALARWFHPQRGWVAPSEFIPLAEQTGLISKIGRWVAGEAIRHLAALAIPALRMSINVSAHQLYQKSFVSEIKDSLATYNMPAERITIEVTETTLMEDAAVQELVKLRALGCRIAIDDFGTGHSSLAYLQRLPVDIIKIDRSFVKPLGQIPKAESFMRALIALAHTLDLEVIVEGVETETQRRILAAMPCDQAQGYFFGKPQPMSTLDLSRTTADP